MAKYEERDPRWIVEDRSDSRNVNNWHWCDKDTSKLTLEFFSNQFKNKTYNIANIHVDTTDVSIPDGDSFVSVRKGKTLKIFCFDLQIEAKYIIGKEEKEFSIIIPNISNEEKYRLIVDLIYKGSVIANVQYVEAIKSFFVSSFEKAFVEYKTLLDKEAEKLLVPFGNTSVNYSGSPENINQKSKENTVYKDISTNNDDFTSVVIEEEFSCSPEQLFEFFTSDEKMTCATGSLCKFDIKPDGLFTMFNGSVNGNFVDIEANRSIKMKWRFSSWKTGFYSIVEITFSQQNNDGVMKFKLNQYNVPHYDYERTHEGWKERVLKPLRYFLGLGSPC